MSTCKDLRRRHRLAAREEKAARQEVRVANAKVVELTKKLSPHYVTTVQAQAEREAVKPFVTKAQEASNRWWRAADELGNLSAAVGSMCSKRSKR